MASKTNAARRLEELDIAYELRDYDVDDDLSAAHVAAQIGMPPAQVFKTLVAKGDRHGVCMAVVAGDAELDLKALARARGDRKTTLVPPSALKELTGYVRGGVTALGAKRSYPVVLDESALEHARISVSAGVRGTQILLAPEDYRRATEATVARIGRRPTVVD